MNPIPVVHKENNRSRMRGTWLVHIAMILMVCFAISMAQGQPESPFGIHVVDDATGRGVPLVTLETTNRITYVTDSNGWVAFDEPGLLGQTVYFGVSSPGYEYRADGFGFRGIALPTKPGGEATLKIHRVQIAQRIYRLTGQGIYADTIRLGKKAPIDQPLLNAQVMGQDSVCTVAYNDKLYWFWGDTNRIGYVLGNFHSTGATTPLPGSAGFDPSIGVNLNYFTAASGFVQPLFGQGEQGMIWVSGPMVLQMPDGPTIVVSYSRRKSLSQSLGHGLAVWNDKTHTFTPRVEFPLDRSLPRGASPFRRTVEGVDYYYFTSPYPLVRVKADWKDVSNLDAYESYTPLMAGTRFHGDKSKIERNPQGKVIYAWKRNTDYVSEARQRILIKAGLLTPTEAWIDLRDAKSDTPIFLASGSVSWSAYRKKWIMIAGRKAGTAGNKADATALLGDVYYSEADAPEGPWRKTVRIAIHPHYSYYNVLQHRAFSQDGGRFIYFEGTYATTFSGNKCPTPRYEYNQVMCQLDLSDPRLALNGK